MGAVRKGKTFNNQRSVEHILEHCEPENGEQLRALDEARKELRALRGPGTTSAAVVCGKRKSSGSDGGIPRDFFDPPRKKKARKAFAKMIAGTGIAPTLAENTLFLDFCLTLNSGYSGVTANTVRYTDIPALYADVQKQIIELMDGKQKLTLGWDGFKGEDNVHVVNFCEGAGGATASRKCFDPEGRREDQLFFNQIVIDELKAGAAERGMTVEEAYCGIVGGNVACNLGAMRHVEAEYPKIIVGSCVAHGGDLLCEDLAGIPEIDEAISQAKSLVVFVKGHKYVKSRFDDIRSKIQLSPNSVRRPRSLKLFPKTRFGYASLMLEIVLENKRSFQTLLMDDEWEDLSSGIAPSTLQFSRSQVAFRTLTIGATMVVCVVFFPLSRKPSTTSKGIR